MNSSHVSLSETLSRNVMNFPGWELSLSKNFSRLAGPEDDISYETYLAIALTSVKTNVILQIMK